ncbi:hypothetical protein F4859DRAFT_487018 [Xylaria cf. heliscus]|nr:hypothetical protein F4859DRAFT_487018 [Xylaria cf. heliscus]
MATQPPYYQTSVRSTQVAPFSPADLETPAHGLPAPVSSPIRATMMTPNDFEMPGQRQKKVFSLQIPKPSPRPTPNPTSRHNLIEVSKNHSQASTPSRRQVQREYELKDEAYPLKLIRELDQTLGRMTVQAANDRSLDFWDRNYGTKMFTDASPVFETDTDSMKFEHIEGSSESHSYHMLSHKTPNYRLSGGVPAHGSHWEINNKCLSLSHKDDEGDRKVYVIISYVQDQGIQV